MRAGGGQISGVLQDINIPSGASRYPSGLWNLCDWT
jgi:hypothetical protein